MVIYKTKQNFKISQEQETNILEKIKESIYHRLKVRITRFKCLANGQNINYQVYIDEDSTPTYLLRIITKSGYPDYNTLKICDELLSNAKIKNPKIVYFHSRNDIVPYGFFLLDWMEGIDGSIKYPDEKDLTWVRDYVKILNEVHAIKLPHFGYLNGPSFKTLQEYYKHLDVVIDHSFGNVLKNKASIWDLEHKKVTSVNFLKTTFQKIEELSLKIKHKVEPILVHGDMFSENLIYQKNDVALIDWDEARAHCYAYELARTTFYIDSKEIVATFLIHYNHHCLTMEELDFIIRLEHIRQLLRMMMITCFNRNIEDVKIKVKELEELVKERLVNPYI